MKLFKNKPRWIYTEIDEITYWIHLGILSAVVLGLLQLWQGGEMFTLMNVLISIPLLAIGDTLAHSILKMR